MLENSWAKSQVFHVNLIEIMALSLQPPKTTTLIFGFNLVFLLKLLNSQVTNIWCGRSVMGHVNMVRKRERLIQEMQLFICLFW